MYINNSIKKNKKKLLFIYGFLAWPIIHFIVFWIGMNFGTFINSFFKISLDGSRTFVAFEQYKDILSILTGAKSNGVLNYHAVWNTFSLIPLSLFINLPITLIFAYGIYKKIAGHRIFRTVLFLPAIISIVVLTLAFRTALNDKTGIVIKFLNLLGLAGDGTSENQGIIPIGGWLGNNDTMWGTILIFSVWTGVSGSLIYFTSAMSRLPKSIFESAELDGASEFKQFFSIVMPLIWPTVTTMSITLVAGVFSWFLPSLLLTDGADRATTMALMIMQVITNDHTNTVMSAFGVLIAIFGSVVILSFKKLMEKITEEVQY